MRNPQGYATIVDPDARQSLSEHDTITCVHCGHVDMTRGPSGNLECMVFRADGTHYFREAGFCRSCMRPICPRCNGLPCSNRFRRLDLEERAASKLIL